MDTQATVLGAAGVAAFVRLAIWVLRPIGLPDKWTPLLAVLLGVALTVAAVSFVSRETILTAIVLGAMAGGTAVASHEVQEQLRG